jgi:hypothetical protein
MSLPFDREQFFGVMMKYNLDVFPAQFIIFLLTVISLILIRYKVKNAGMIAFIVLGLFWLWMGFVYHLFYFTAINKAAYGFGALFALQGTLFVLHAFRSPVMTMENNPFLPVSLAFILFSMLIYPVTGFFLGHQYPSSPTFGLPCPTTIFTFGMLLLVADKIPPYLLIIPLLWSVIGFTASFTLGVYEDVSLLISALIFVILVVKRNRRNMPQESR